MTAQAGSVSFPSMSPLAGDSRDALRREMRQRRRSISLSERANASKQLKLIADRHRLFRPSMRVAVYLAYGHEASCDSLIELAHARGCTVYVPRVVSYRYRRMVFVPHKLDAKLTANKYGIAEPAKQNIASTPIRRLDLVVLPVVAVDQQGYRLGSGAGFYDRALHHLRQGRRWRRPKLLALAYDVQCIERLPSHRWDVPVDAILTEKRLYRIPTSQDENLT
jgi:5-formyltetrahydrofolate cyclo-ligase